MGDLDKLSDEAIDQRIWDIKKRLKDRLFIPVHHYQRDEIVQFADYVGDSLELSRISSETSARYIVFCGVYFMAEIARVIASRDKLVFIPDKSAGCPLADFASPEAIEWVWNIIQKVHPDEYIPITYANSHVGVKAFCGKNHGLVCTSSNAQKLFEWILDQNKRVYFIPDRNLGFNTAKSMGLKDESVIIDKYSCSEKSIKDKRIVIWDGFCNVHTKFKIEHVEYWRNLDKDIKIIVHPECNPAVVDASDYSGSTAKIKKMVEESDKESKWVIGTEYNMVNRLKEQNSDRFIEPLHKSICYNMSKDTRGKLLKVLLNIESGDCSDEVTVPEDISKNAKMAVEMMLKIS